MHVADYTAQSVVLQEQVNMQAHTRCCPLCSCSNTLRQTRQCCQAPQLLNQGCCYATAADTATAGSCGSLSLPLLLLGAPGHSGPPAASTGEPTSAST